MSLTADAWGRTWCARVREGAFACVRVRGFCGEVGWEVVGGACGGVRLRAKGMCVCGYQAGPPWLLRSCVLTSALCPPGCAAVFATVVAFHGGRSASFLALSSRLLRKASSYAALAAAAALIRLEVRGRR